MNKTLLRNRPGDPFAQHNDIFDDEDCPRWDQPDMCGHWEQDKQTFDQTANSLEISAADLKKIAVMDNGPDYLTGDGEILFSLSNNMAYKDKRDKPPSNG